MQRNACKLCAPLGASLVLRGIEAAMPFLHGSQGCATYIRRYMISHFREPLDIASSSFSEETAIFGGRAELLEGIKNVARQYSPSLIGVISTCLAETIGEDTDAYLKSMRAAGELPDCDLVYISAPSFEGTHTDGFRRATRALAEKLCVEKKGREQRVNVLPAFLSAADLRYLRELIGDFGVRPVMLPDYSESMDGEIWESYQRLPKGCEKLECIKGMGDSLATIEMGTALPDEWSAGKYLQDKFNVPNHRITVPVGVKATDKLMEIVSSLTGKPVPASVLAERGRLIDSYVDGHKYMAGKKAVVFGDEDLVAGIAGFLAEIGITPVLCASGTTRGAFESELGKTAGGTEGITVKGDVDYMDIEAEVRKIGPDLMIGNSKGFAVSRRLNIPLIRVGFPVHDRIGAQRILHIGYRGAQSLFDRIVNTLMEKQQEAAAEGYTYI